MTFSDNPEGDAMNVEVAVDTATTTETLACGKRFILRIRASAKIRVYTNQNFCLKQNLAAPVGQGYFQRAFKP